FGASTGAAGCFFLKKRNILCLLCADGWHQHEKPTNLQLFASFVDWLSLTIRRSSCFNRQIGNIPVMA
ncbi:hypothetical protein ACFQ5J_09875, partial [Lacticaseibacillus baoqingensis]